MQEEYYTVNEVAERFKVNRKTVYDWMRAGELRFVYVGGHRRITKSAIEAFIREGKPEQPEKQEEEIVVPALALA